MIRVSPHKCHMVSRMLLQPIYYFCFLLRFGQMLRFYVVKRLPLADMLNIVASFHSALLGITFFNQYIISSFDVFCHIYAYDQLLLLVCSPAESRSTVCFFYFLYSVPECMLLMLCLTLCVHSSWQVRTPSLCMAMLPPHTGPHPPTRTRSWAASTAPTARIGSKTPPGRRNWGDDYPSTTRPPRIPPPWTMTPAVCAPFLFPFVDLVVDLVPVLQKALKVVQKCGLCLGLPLEVMLSERALFSRKRNGCGFFAIRSRCRPKFGYEAISVIQSALPRCRRLFAVCRRPCGRHVAVGPRWLSPSVSRPVLPCPARSPSARSGLVPRPQGEEAKSHHAVGSRLLSLLSG